MNDTLIKKQQVISYLSFSLSGEDFALNVGHLINILEMQDITKVPQSPPYITGIINLRGEVLPVLDTNKKLGLGETRQTGNTCILVLETEISDSKTKFGILVDGVHEVLEIEDHDILPSPSIGNKFNSHIISGMVEQESRFIMLINIEELFEVDNMLDLMQMSNCKK